MLLALAAHGATIEVGGAPGGPQDVVAALASAAPGDTILVHAGTWDGQVVVPFAITILAADGPGTAVLTATDRSLGEPVVVVDQTGELTMSGITIDGDDGQRALELLSGARADVTSLTFVRPPLATGTKLGRGGAVVVEADATLQLFDPAFAEPPSGVSDGGYVTADVDAAITIHGGWFEGGHAVGRGGAIFATGATVVLDGVTFRGNTADHEGGAVSVENADGAEVAGCVFEANQAGLAQGGDGRGGGGGLHAKGGSIVLTDGSFVSNTAESGGAVYLEGGTAPVVARTVLEGNVATDGDGGGLVASGPSDLLVEIVRIEASTASGRGGGIFVDEAEGATLRGLVVCGGTAEQGGGIALLSTDAEVRNAILADGLGTATRESGGGVWADDGEVLLDHVAVLGTSGDVAVVAVGGVMTVRNTLVAFSEQAPLDDRVGGDHDAFWANGSAPPAGLGEPVDPELRDYVPGRCSGDFRPGSGSALFDLGVGTDADGSPADVGAFGGLDWDAVDADLDGVPGRTDCDDFDPLAGECGPVVAGGDQADGASGAERLPPVFFCAARGGGGGPLVAVVAALVTARARRRRAPRPPARPGAPSRG